MQFFADEQDVLDYVRGRKHYKQQPYIRFIEQDYTTPLPLRENSYDLLIALYATGAAEACHAYLKSGGLLLSNNHHDDAGQALRSGDYDLVAAMFYDGDTCQITGTDLEQYFVPKPRRSRKKHLSLIHI